MREVRRKEMKKEREVMRERVKGMNDRKNKGRKVNMMGEYRERRK